MPRPKSNKEYVRLRRLLDGHLRSSPPSPSSSAPPRHLDEDALSAFVEGRLSERESAPVISHLVGCHSCRSITAQLVRLATELSGEEERPAHVPVEEPGRIRRLLADLAARVLPSADEDSVFAYHAPADDFEKKEEPKGGEESKREEQD